MVFGLVLAATILSVTFATRGAMASNRPIVEVLHFVGAKDAYIARQFQRHFLRLGLRGGLVGGGACIVLFLALGAVTETFDGERGGRTGGGHVRRLFAGAQRLWADHAHRVRRRGVAGLMSRAIVFRQLRRLR